jgi:hypothetical protein
VVPFTEQQNCLSDDVQDLSAQAAAKSGQAIVPSRENTGSKNSYYMLKDVIKLLQVVFEKEVS